MSVYISIDNRDNNKNIGTAAIVPNVPGAFGDKPLPKPNARNCIGLRKLNLVIIFTLREKKSAQNHFF